MSVSKEGLVLRLLGPCGVEDAEPLLAHLVAEPGLAVDLSAAGPLHTAVVQALLRVRPPILGPASDPFTARWIAPALASRG